MPLVPFGERVLFKQIEDGKNRRDKFESEDRAVVWLGFNREAHEVLTGTPSGVVRAFSYTRRSECCRWDADLIKITQGTPQQAHPTRLGVGIPIKVRFSEPAHVDEAIPKQLARQEQGPRRMRIMPYMLEKNVFLLRDVKGVGTSRLVFMAHEIILKRVESESWRPYARIRLTFEFGCSKNIAMRLNACADMIFILRNRKRWSTHKRWIMDADTMAV